LLIRKKKFQIEWP